MTVDTSNPNKLQWRDLPREVKAEMLMQNHEGALVEWHSADGWSDLGAGIVSGIASDDIIRIRPAEKRETVTLGKWVSKKSPFADPYISEMIEFETVNGEIDKSVQPRWVGDTSEWSCPLHDADCKSNCGAYHCGN